MKPTIWMLLLLCLMTNFNLAAQNLPAAFKETDAAFATYYQQQLKQHGIVGSSFMLVHDQRIVAQHIYGLAQADAKRAVDEQTIFHWASITKTLTGIAILQLRDRGLLKLDDPIVKYVPELRAVHNPFGPMETITLRHLLSHSAGFRAGTWPWGGDKPWQPHEPQHWSQLVAMFPYTEILFAPGSKFSYSNPGIIFLGRVIEALTKDDYEVYIDKNIFKPLQMYRSYFDATPYHLLPHRAQSYFLQEGKLTAARFDADTGITVSNGGLNAPLPDMANYVKFLLGDVRNSTRYDQILKRASLEEMWQPQVSIMPDAIVTPEGQQRKDAMGLTFFIEDNFGQHFIGHSGSQNGFLSHFYLRPDNRTAYLIAYNTHATPSATHKAQDTRLLDRELKDWLFARMFPLFKQP